MELCPVLKFNVRGSVALATASFAGGANLRNEMFVDLATAHSFHHGQMFEVVVGLEKCVSGEELNKNATDAPYIAREAPSKV